MTQHTETTSIKFRLVLHPWDGLRLSAERLWGHWIDQKKGLISCRNNAFQVPLAINDTVRVARDGDGMWQVVEIVRLTESIVTMTSFEPPVTVKQALAIYDGWVQDGKAIHTEGAHGVMRTVWKEFLPVMDVLCALSQCDEPGWETLEVFTPAQRRELLDQLVNLNRGKH